MICEGVDVHGSTDEQGCCYVQIIESMQETKQKEEGRDGSSNDTPLRIKASGVLQEASLLFHPKVL